MTVEQPLMADGTPLSLFVRVSLGCTARLSRRNLNAQREYSTASSLRNRNLAILLISRGRLCGQSRALATLSGDKKSGGVSFPAVTGHQRSDDVNHVFSRLPSLIVL